MRQNFPFVLVGNALATMVTATKLAQSGADVVIVNGSKNWGGHFTTIACGGLSYDAGMVLHEFTSYNRKDGKEDLRTYDPAIRNDSGRFCETVRQYISLYQASKAIAAPKMYVEGGVYDDMLIANSLSALRNLPFADAVKSELLSLLDSPPPFPLHASCKHRSEDFKRLDYRSVSLANHGNTLHARLIEPFCRKLLNIATRDVLALYHRVPWLPLFYPETLLSYLHGTPQELPPTVFSYPVGECVGDLAKKLKSEIQDNKHITVISEHPCKVKIDMAGKYEMTFANQAEISADQLAWSNNPGDLLRALGLENRAGSYEKCSIALAFLRIPTNALKLDFTVLSIVDPHIAAYRITNQSRCSGLDAGFSRIVVELNVDYAAALEESAVKPGLGQRVAEELVALGIVADGADVECVELKEMKNALMLPNGSNRNSFAEEMAAALDAAPEISLLGPASGFFSSSLNDQIVQGLKLSALWERLA